MLKYSFTTLLLVISVTSIGFASLTNPTPLWQQTLLTGLLGMLTFASIAAFVCGLKARAIAVGFCLGAGIHLVFSTFPLRHTDPESLTDRMSNLIWRHVHPEEKRHVHPQKKELSSQDAEQILIDSFRRDETDRERFLKKERFMWIATCLWAIIFGAAGMVVARILFTVTNRATRMDPPVNL